MNILEKLKQVFIPVNQPKNFPRLYFIPETIHADAPNQASNDPLYQQVPARVYRRRWMQIPRPIRYFRQLRARFYKRCADAWSALKEAGRRVVRWLVWRVVLPLSVLCAIWLPFANPAELY